MLDYFLIFSILLKCWASTYKFASTAVLKLIIHIHATVKLRNLRQLNTLYLITQQSLILFNVSKVGKGKATPLQAWTAP
jgi:hypothetical protein